MARKVRAAIFGWLLCDNPAGTPYYCVVADQFEVGLSDPKQRMLHQGFESDANYSTVYQQCESGPNLRAAWFPRLTIVLPHDAEENDD